MIDNKKYIDGLGKLREYLARLKANGRLAEVANEQAEVLGRFQPIFSPETISQIKEDEFLSFLYFENNKHWYSLYRQRNYLTADLNVLRNALVILLDENQEVGLRLEKAINLVFGLGKAVSTAILLVAFPEKYGVWNNLSEVSMKQLGLWPEFPRGASLSQKYNTINELMIRLKNDLDTDLWTLDMLWWVIETEPDTSSVISPESSDSTEPDPLYSTMRFGLERHLHEFLRDNWTQTELGQTWNLYGEPGDDDPGYEFPTSVGFIDLLAKHKTDPRWLIIELKRSQTSDVTVGQIMRYMGWVKRNLANSDETVEGLIIAQHPDQKLLYALEMQANVDLKLYEVEFKLRNALQPGI
jgi:hypothetical protein